MYAICSFSQRFHSTAKLGFDRTLGAKDPGFCQDKWFWNDEEGRSKWNKEIEFVLCIKADNITNCTLNPASNYSINGYDDRAFKLIRLTDGATKHAYTFKLLFGIQFKMNVINYSNFFFIVMNHYHSLLSYFTLFIFP